MGSAGLDAHGNGGVFTPPLRSVVFWLTAAIDADEENILPDLIEEQCEDLRRELAEARWFGGQARGVRTSPYKNQRVPC